MTEFKKGARVVVEGTVSLVDASTGAITAYWVTTASGRQLLVRPDDLKVAPYRDPELQPGQVVMSEDESDERSWWVRRTIGGGLCFLAPTANGDGAAYRNELPGEIRVVWPR